MVEHNLNGQTLNIVEENVKKLKQLFPEIVIEDKIDFQKLQAVLGNYIEQSNESYRFTWYGKSDAFRKSQTPSTGTLRPCIEDSKNWDTTQNLYIEGDNLEVLKLLQKSYNSEVQMIYIDPPYNKDKDFVYPDKWSDTIKQYKRITGQLDDEGNVTTSETETEGGKHTNWLNMMYPRLRLAWNLLKDDGVMFISIDDDEVENLKKLCNEVFGEENFVACLVWEKKKKGSFLSNDITNIKEYIYVYAKSKNEFKGLIGEINSNTETYPCVNASNKREIRTIPKGITSKYKESNFTLAKGNIISDTTMSLVLHSDLIIVDNVLAEDLVIEGNWRYSQDAMTEYATKKELYVTRDLYLRRIVSDARNKTLKDLLPRVGDSENSVINLDNLFETGWGSNEDADEEQRLLFGVQKVMDYPKPVKLLYKLMASYRNKEYLIMDFFSGSATTAHAVMQLNSNDNGNRKYIMIQLPENLDNLLSKATDDNTKKTIKSTIEFLESINRSHSLAEIGKERIRRAGEGIKMDLMQKYEAYQQKQETLLVADDEQAPMNPDDLDIGFKVFKLDSSNLKKWSVDVGEDFYKESKEEQNAILSEMLGLEIDNFVDDRSELDMVFEIMLKYGLDLTYPIETYTFNGRNVYSIGFGSLIITLDRELTEDLADDIVNLIKELEPHTVRVAVRDLSFISDDAKTNFKETLRNGVESYFTQAHNKQDKENQFDFITI